MKRLSFEQIEHSDQIQNWLQGFPNNRAGAIEMLLRLIFVSSDEFTSWLRVELERRRGSVHGVFAVRKDLSEVWDKNGITFGRPAQSQGSEDLIQSIIANIKKDAKDFILDHPGIAELREKKVQEILLIDDSIGTGKRVSDYIKAMLRNRHFRSWWSYGYLKLTVLAYARTLDSESRVLSTIGGSNHPLRKYPTGKKVSFDSHLCYARDSRERWGPAWQHIFDAARSANGVRKDRQLGYGKTMSNVVFYHSVPNNLPGMLWFDSASWHPLFPHRKLPSWVVQLLDDTAGLRESKAAQSRTQRHTEPEMVCLLSLVKTGFRNENRIAWKAGLDRRVVVALLMKLRSLGLVSRENRITEAGRNYLKRANAERTEEVVGWKLYVPSTWRADRATIQPSRRGSLAFLDRTESAESPLDADGEVGQTSLEKTDAKTAPPSLDVMTESPAVSWNGHDIHGPKG